MPGLARDAVWSSSLFGGCRPDVKMDVKEMLHLLYAKRDRTLSEGTRKFGIYFSKLKSLTLKVQSNQGNINSVKTLVVGVVNQR